MREKLIELLKSGGVRDFPFNAALADHLIANGVTMEAYDCHWATETAYKNGYAHGVKDAADNNVGSKWIPVTERLPEEHDKYLCNVKSFAFPGRFYHAILQYDKYGFREGRIYTDDVTHWMPLPEPPKGE